MAYSTKETKSEELLIEKDSVNEKLSFSASVSIILENVLYSIDPLLLIRICSYLDMLSVMRFQSVSLKISKFLSKNIELQSLYETSTDYVIDQALASTQQKDKKEAIEEEDQNTDAIFSELVYRFPNNNQYDHYIMLETDANIFAPFHRIKRLHLKILPPKSSDAVFSPSSSYFETIHKQEEEKEETDDAKVEEFEEEEETEEITSVNMNYLLLNSAVSRFAASRAPITAVETSIYSRSIFAYFDCYFQCIQELIIEFDPHLFVSTFLTFNIPQILSKIRRLRLIKKVVNDNIPQTLSAKDIYCHECVSLLQYTRNLRELSFNFPLSSDFYPIIAELESLKIMHRIEQPQIVDTSTRHSGYSQNIATLNNKHSTTLISNVKLQKSLLLYFCPSIASLHLHGSKGVQQLTQFTDEELSCAVLNRHKVFFGLTELCVHCSSSVYDFISKYLAVVPQLSRLQIIFGANSSIYDLQLLLNHFNSNCVLNLSFNEKRDNLLSYYYNYYIYYGYNLTNCAQKLRYLYLSTKKTNHAQNYQLFRCIKNFFNIENIKQCRLTLLYFMLFVQYQYWNTNDLMTIIQFIAQHQDIFARHFINYRILMPLKRRYFAPSNKMTRNKIEEIRNEFKYKSNDKYQAFGDDEVEEHFNSEIIDKNSLKGIASFVKQQNVGVLRIISVAKHKQDRDSDIVVIEKITSETQNTAAETNPLYKKYVVDDENDENNNDTNGTNAKDTRDDRQVYKEKIAQKQLKRNQKHDPAAAAAAQWINECYYCDLLK